MYRYESSVKYQYGFGEVEMYMDKGANSFVSLDHMYMCVTMHL